MTKSKKKIEKFKFNGIIKGVISHTFSGWTMCKKFSVDGNFSIFGRNSWVSKVLTHEISGEIQKKIKIFKFDAMIKGCNY